jgi:STE24 endopeptidase
MTAQTILLIYLVFFGAEFLFHRALTILNLRYIQRKKDRLPGLFKGLIDEETFERSIDYTGENLKFSLIRSAAGAAFLLGLILTGTFGSIEELVSRISFPPRIEGIVYIFSISLLFGLFSIPFSLYSEFVIERKYGFSTMTVKLFIIDLIKGMLLSALLMFPILYCLFLFIDVFPVFWWLVAFGAVSVFQLLMNVLYPVIIAPIFNKFAPLEEGRLRERLEGLAERLSFKTKGIFVMDGSKRSKHSNAYFTGIGKVKRIVLFDTLVEKLEEEEIEAVLAHEIAHEKKKHTVKSFLLSQVIMLGGLFIVSLLLGFTPLFKAFGFSELSPHALLVILTFCAGPFTFFFKPLFTMLSRKFEYAADAYAVQHIESAEALKSGLIRLAKSNLSNLTPHPWYSFYHYSHPAPEERLKALEPASG